MSNKPSRLSFAGDEADSFADSQASTGLPRTIRRHELRLIAPLADSTIYEMERRGEFPRRFNLPAMHGLGSERG